MTATSEVLETAERGPSPPEERRCSAKYFARTSEPAKEVRDLAWRLDRMLRETGETYSRSEPLGIMVRAVSLVKALQPDYPEAAVEAHGLAIRAATAEMRRYGVADHDLAALINALNGFLESAGFEWQPRGGWNDRYDRLEKWGHV